MAFLFGLEFLTLKRAWSFSETNLSLTQKRKGACLGPVATSFFSSSLKGFNRPWDIGTVINVSFKCL